MKREVQIKLKAVSADHCNISYTAEKGWAVSEKGKDKLSSNGTFVFMKSHAQMSHHEPSDLIPLTDGMVISFINYEIRVNLEKKDADVIAKEKEHLDEQLAAASAVQTAMPAFDATVGAAAEAHLVAAAEQPAPAEEVKPAPIVVEAEAVAVEVTAKEEKEEVKAEAPAEAEAPK